jgi:predicted nucleic acid-binding protein
MRDTDKQLCFIDSNIWLYAFIISEDTDKHLVASRIIENSTICLSSQVINEVCVNLVKKAAFTEERLASLIRSFFDRYQVLTEYSEDLLCAAADLRRSYRFQFWDSLIVASALSCNADILYSEDMHDGLLVQKSLRIINPFNISSKYFP